MVRYLLVILLLLPALCERGWAGNVPDQTDATTSIRIDRKSWDAMLKDYPNAKLRVELTEDPCLAKMEEAMRAWDDHITELTNGPHTIPGEAWRYEQWNAVKKECWKNPLQP